MASPRAPSSRRGRTGVSRTSACCRCGACWPTSTLRRGPSPFAHSSRFTARSSCSLYSASISYDAPLTKAGLHPAPRSGLLFLSPACSSVLACPCPVCVGGLCEVSPPAVLVRRQPFIGPVGQGCRMGCQLHVLTSRLHNYAKPKRRSTPCEVFASFPTKNLNEARRSHPQPASPPPPSVPPPNQSVARQRPAP